MPVGNRIFIEHENSSQKYGKGNFLPLPTILRLSQNRKAQIFI